MVIYVSQTYEWFVVIFFFYRFSHFIQIWYVTYKIKENTFLKNTVPVFLCFSGLIPARGLPVATPASHTASLQKRTDVLKARAYSRFRKVNCLLPLLLCTLIRSLTLIGLYRRKDGSHLLLLLHTSSIEFFLLLFGGSRLCKPLKTEVLVFLHACTNLCMRERGWEECVCACMHTCAHVYICAHVHTHVCNRSLTSWRVWICL